MPSREENPCLVIRDPATMSDRNHCPACEREILDRALDDIREFEEKLFD